MNFKRFLHLAPRLFSGSNKKVCTDLKIISMRSINISSACPSLMEFFDHKKHWGETEIKVGRAWCLDELRIKSNSDIHKLWFILLKEKNMLLTMEHECNEQMRLFPNPERIDKVQESMNNIETVVRERNTAYYELETGETGERPIEEKVNIFGLPFKYENKEYAVPRFMNTKWVKSYLDNDYVSAASVKKFLRLYNEKLRNEERKERNRNFNHVCMLLRRYPDMNIDNLKMEYPDVDIEKAKRSKRSRGHHIPKW